MISRNGSRKRLALKILRSAGVFALTRRLSSRMGRVLMYHNFSAVGDIPGFTPVAVIREQFQYLQQNFRVVSLAHMARALADRTPMDARAVAITIDDGRRNCYEFLFPLLREFSFPATFFVVTSFIRGEDWVWTDKISWLSEQPAAPQELNPEHLAATFYSLNRLRPEQRNQQIETLARRMNIEIPKNPPDRYMPCSWHQLQEMAASGLVEIGSHTINHPILSSISDDESWQELTQSRRQIQDSLGTEVRCFCFPNGMPEDYRPSQLGQVEKAGYTCSVVADFGLVSPGTKPYQIPRIGMGLKQDPLEISKYLDGGAYYQRQLEGLFGKNKKATTHI